MSRIIGVLAIVFMVSVSFAEGIKHRFLAKDESRFQLHYVDQFDSSNDWTIQLEKGCRDIRLLENNRVLVSYSDGFAEFDLRTQKKVAEVRNPKFSKTETVTRLPNGNTILGMGRRGISFAEVDPAGNVVQAVNFPKLHTIRLMRLSPEGHFMFGANTDRVIEADWTGKILVNLRLEGAKHIYWIRKLETGYRVSTGYSHSIVDVDLNGTVLRDLGGDDDLHFFSRPFELRNGNVVVSHWTGHKPDDSKKAPQILEYDPQGNVVWKWHDPERAGTIHGVIVFEDQPAHVEAQLKDFDEIQRNINDYHPDHWAEFERVSSEALRNDAMILASDKTPVDVILRRTQALMDHLGMNQEQAALDALKSRNGAHLSVDEQKALFLEVATIRRTIAFGNPLLDFDSLVFLKHHRMARGESHMVDQYLGFNQSAGGGLYRLDDVFSDVPRETDLLAESTVANGWKKGELLTYDSGSFISLDLDYDAGEVLFAYAGKFEKGSEKSADWNGQPWTSEQASKHRSGHYCWKPETSFHVFRAKVDGTELRQLTFGDQEDFDPCFLPNGRIAFISSRCGGNQRCGGRFTPTYVLHGMMGDGSDVQQLSFHDTNEWHPSVNNEGMLIYTRWDYVDRDSDIAHHLWFCGPDGRDPRSMHGNYPDRRSLRPWMVLQHRAVPDSKKVIGVAAPHHGESYGSLVLIDQSVRDDREMSQVKRITPLSAFSESESTPGRPWHIEPRAKKNQDCYNDLNYASPWPLNEDFYICVYAPEHGKHGNSRKDRHGIYLVDSFGNRELIYEDPDISVLDPIPLKARKRPPVLPVKTTQMKADRSGGEDLSIGIVSVMNVYEGEFPIPEGVKVKELRVVNFFPKDTHSINNPKIGHADQSLARGSLGTVPVEEDGSVHFECPTGTGIAFQLLDEKGMMIQNMRSATYLHPGETLSCIGCHEDKWEAPNISHVPLAMKRAPSRLKPEPAGSYPISFPRLVQPVLDAHPEFFAELFPGKSLSTEIDEKWGWSNAMHTLSPHAWGKSGGNGALHSKNGNRCYSLPMQEGARVSSLYKKMEKAGAWDTLSEEQMRRITLWLDCNSNFYGAYNDTGAQAAGKVVLPAVGLPKWSKAENYIR